LSEGLNKPNLKSLPERESGFPGARWTKSNAVFGELDRSLAHLPRGNTCRHGTAATLRQRFSASLTCLTRACAMASGWAILLTSSMADTEHVVM
jgi:hypothetical protein